MTVKQADQRAWPHSLTTWQGTVIRSYRERAGKRHAEVVEELAEIGLRLDRTSLINLEQGRRKAITVPEILALAYVLHVPPVLLMAPVGSADEVELFAGRQVASWDAAQWIRGNSSLDTDDDRLLERNRDIVYRHERDTHHQTSMLALNQRIEDGAAGAAGLLTELDQARDDLQDTRLRIHELGLSPAPLMTLFRETFTDYRETFDAEES